ncbi:hypothetical protein ACFL5Q_03585 [Planctomycetota bacterium]
MEVKYADSPSSDAKADEDAGADGGMSESEESAFLQKLAEQLVDMEVLKGQILTSDEGSCGTPFERSLQRQCRAEPEKGSDPQLKDQFDVIATAKKELQEVQPHFTSFYQYFLRVEVEQGLEDDIGAASKDDPRRAGMATESFVWVCPDFEDLNLALPENFALSDDAKVGIDELERHLNDINRPYREFFRRHEVACLGPYYTRISNYWRTRGQAARSGRMFASFAQDKCGLTVPDREILDQQGLADPVPQNIFLRVKICDSLNEPFINGLFVFSTDHDEVNLRGKEPGLRQEDVEDLLSFAKVFFFIVRDHVHGLDSAREASDLGRLNQHLYDQRLADLDVLMNRGEGRERDVADEEDWDRFVYEILNNYAFSVLDKPDDVRTETFPYDRLLIIPLDQADPDSPEGSGEFDLPFYMFQSIYVECDQGKIDGRYYSLLKPYQSPVEEIDVKEADRFKLRSFQQVSISRGAKKRLEKYLEKHYVGARDPKRDPDVPDGEPPSFVAKSGPHDTGRTWAQKAIEQFWILTRHDPEKRDENRLWQPFLRKLTSDYRKLMPGEEDDSDLTNTQIRSLEVWFLCRFALLKSIVNHVSKDDPWLAKIEEAYATQELRLRFDDREDFNVLKMAMAPGKDGDAFDQLERRNRKLSMPDDPLQEIGFLDYLVGSEDPWIVTFFECLTRQIGNDAKYLPSSDPDVRTWYQPLLTRPVEELGISGGDVHTAAARKIGRRMPQYAKMRTGDDALAMFLGVVNVAIGRTESERRRLRCVVVMMRDYDDRRIGREQLEEEIEEKLEKDRRDLTLYSRTFFQNVHRYLATARERQQVRTLSTDIAQIARNWYSDGIDLIDDRLQSKLREMVRKATDGANLGRLQPHMITCVFDTMIKDVLLHREFTRNNEPIELESFPFDRVLHVPLLFGETDAAQLSYARTRPEAGGEAEGGSLDAGGGEYGRIRRSGRDEVLGSGKKLLATDPPIHLGEDDRLAWKEFWADEDQKVSTTLFDLVQELADDGRLLDAFVRRLYQANALQTLAVAGTVRHILTAIRIRARKGHDENADAATIGPSFAELTRRLQEVVQDSITAVERNQRETMVVTDVHMNRAVSFTPVPVVRDGAVTGLESSAFESAERIPILRELFRAIEGNAYEYGLQPNVRSKVFYVYYSIPAPDGFIDALEFGPRYRGVFCFIVDDNQTHDKSLEPDAEVADQGDIRTLVHNAMGRLRLVLDLQARENRILQPGVDEFVNGLLHRLKNELNEPGAVLYKLQEHIRLQGDFGDRHQELLNRIGDAQSSITRIGDVFRRLKGFSETQRGIVPMQKFTSDRIGWLLLSKLCVATLKEVQALDSPGEPGAEVRSVRAAIEGILQEAEDHLSRIHLESTTVQRIQRELVKLGEELATLAHIASGSETPIELLLSFEVFSNEPLSVRGSHQLEEALNILIENAFQAMWAFILETATAKRQDDGLLTARLGLRCRASEDKRDEVLLEIENSSNGLNPEFKKILNAAIPQPISAQRYTKSSGRKTGGSGFGHYHARRVISEFCGGPQARRRLDVWIDETDNDSVLTRVNLLKAVLADPRTVPGREILDRAASVLGEVSEELEAAIRNALETEPEGTLYAIPGDVDVSALFEVIRTLLIADRQLKEEALFSLAKLDACRDIKFSARKTRRELIALLRPSEDSDPPDAAAKEMLQDLEDKRKTRDLSYHDLCLSLQRWHQRCPELVRNLIEQGSEVLKRRLRPFCEDGEFQPLDLLSEKERESFASNFRDFEPYLKEDVVAKGSEAILEHLQSDESGRPVPNREVITAAFRPESWACQVMRTDAQLTFAFRLSDVAAGEYKSNFQRNAAGDRNREVDVLGQFRKEPLAYTFAQYQAGFRQGVGDMAMERYPSSSSESTSDGISSDPKQEPAPTEEVLYRTVFLTLNAPGNRVPETG